MREIWKFAHIQGGIKASRIIPHTVMPISAATKLSAVHVIGNKLGRLTDPISDTEHMQKAPGSLVNIRNAPQTASTDGPGLRKTGLVARLRAQWEARAASTSAHTPDAVPPSIVLRIHCKPTPPPSSVFSCQRARTPVAPIRRSSGPVAKRIARRLHGSKLSAPLPLKADASAPRPQRNEDHPNGLRAAGLFPVRISEVHPRFWAMQDLGYDSVAVEPAKFVLSDICNPYGRRSAVSGPLDTIHTTNGAASPHRGSTAPLEETRFLDGQTGLHSTAAVDPDAWEPVAFNDGGNEWEVWEELFSPEELAYFNDRFEREEREMAALDGLAAGSPALESKPVMIEPAVTTRDPPASAASICATAELNSDEAQQVTTYDSSKPITLLDAVRAFNRETGLRRAVDQVNLPKAVRPSMAGVLNRAAVKMFDQHSLNHLALESSPEEDGLFVAREEAEWDA